jgi:hypothetical protein
MASHPRIADLIFTSVIPSNSILARKISGPKQDEVTNLVYIIQRGLSGWSGHPTAMEEHSNAYRILAEGPLAKREFGRRMNWTLGRYNVRMGGIYN